MEVEADALWKYSIRALRKIRRQQVVELALSALAGVEGCALSSVQLAEATHVPVFTLGELITNHPKIRKSIRVGARIESKRASVWYELVSASSKVE